MPNNQNLAYDVSMMTEPALQRQAQLGMRKPRVHRRRLSLRRTVALMLCAMVASGALLISQVQLTGVSDRLSQANRELELLSNTGALLDAELQARLSVANVEEYARDRLGLVKADNSQMEYVNYAHQSKVVDAVEPEESLWERLLSWF